MTHPLTGLVDFSPHCSPHTVAIALGSNLGDPLATLAAALEQLGQVEGVRVLRRSPWYETEPIGPPQPNYLNGCAVLEVQHSPLQLLDILLAVEQQFGRVRRERWGPRTLDLDLLLFNDLILDLPRLQIPHPRMGDRAFVLVPLATIAPDWLHPVTRQAIAQMAQQVNTAGVMPLGSQLC